MKEYLEASASHTIQHAYTGGRLIGNPPSVQLANITESAYFDKYYAFIVIGKDCSFKGLPK
jgi:hypothetical protein